MHRIAAMTAIALCFAVPAFAQGYAPEPPPGYMAAPPRDWEHQDFWRHKKEAERDAFWRDYRRESWRCDHGDREACHWLHEHERG